MHQPYPTHSPFHYRTEECVQGVLPPNRPESQVALVTLGRALGYHEKTQDESSPRPSDTFSESDTVTKHDTAKPRRESGVSHLHPIDEYGAEADIAPVDQPPEIQALQDREPFAILARHLSGVSTGTGAGGEPAPPTFDPPPDGGATAWLVVMGAWFVLFVQFGIST